MSFFSAIVLAAGRGKRMKPFSDKISKPMLPLLNKPVISLVVERLIIAGVVDIILVTSKENHNEMKTFFDKQKYSNKIEYCIQDPPKGTADAIYRGGLKAKTDVIFSVAGDNLFSQNFINSMVEKYIFFETSCLLALQQVTKEEIKSLASVELDSKGYVVSIIEKPKQNQIKSNLASILMYVFSKSLLSYFRTVNLSSRGELEAPEAFLSMMVNNEVKINTNITTEKYIHISNPLDLWKVNMDFLKENNCIDKNSKIDLSSKLKNCVIGSNVEIQERVKLERCLVLENTKIIKDTNLNSAIIGNKDTISMEIYQVNNN